MWIRMVGLLWFSGGLEDMDVAVDGDFFESGELFEEGVFWDGVGVGDELLLPVFDGSG